MNWKMVFDFIIEYWKEILSATALLISVLVNIIRKRPSYNGVAEIKEDVLELLPAIIKRVEQDGNGQLKKNAVLDFVKKYVQKKYGVEVPANLLDFFSTSIEDILSAPQKKAR